MSFATRARESATVALAAGLLWWYRGRLALPRPFGGAGLLGRRFSEWAEDVGCARSAPDEPAAARVAELFLRAARRPGLAAGCAPRSLALARLLRLHGFPARLRVGLRRAGGRLAGHAWVEHHGRIVGDDLVFVRGFAPLEWTRRARGGSWQ